MGPIIAIAVKDLKLLLRDRTAAFFVFIFPIFVALFFGIIFGGGGRDGGGGRMPVAVVDESKGPRAAQLVRSMTRDAALEITEVQTRAEGETRVRRGESIACVIVPASFDQGLMQVFSGGGLTLEVVIDPSRSADAGMLEGKLNELAFRQLSSMMQDPTLVHASTAAARAALLVAPLSGGEKSGLSTLFRGLDEYSAASAAQQAERKRAAEPPAPTEPGAPRTTAKEPDGDADEDVDQVGGWRPLTVEVRSVIRERRGPNSSFEVSFGQGVVWGLMSCVTGFGASIAEERSRGTLLRLRTAPIRRRQILLGKALAAFIACMLVQALLIGLGLLPFFGVHYPNPALVVVSTLVTSIGFCGLMMMLAGLTKTEGAAQGLGRAVVLVLAMIGGGTIPIFIMPAWLQAVSRVSPFSWAATVIDGYTWRNFTWAEMALPLGVLCAVGVIGFVIGTLAMRWQEE